MSGARGDGARAGALDRSDFDWERRGRVLGVSVLAMGLAWLLGPREFLAADTVFYQWMAEHPPGQVLAPWAYRILAPALVGWLPLSTSAGFWTVTYLGTLLLLLGMYELLRGSAVSHRTASITLILLGLSFPIAFYLNHWGLVDPVGNLFNLVILLLILRRWYLPAAAILGIGCLAKETSLLLAPLLVWESWRHREGDARIAVVRALPAVLAPIATLIVVRRLIPTAPGQWDLRHLDDVFRQLRFIWDYNVSGYGLPLRIAREILRSYSFIWVLAFLGLRLQPRFRELCLYLLTVSVALCFIATDWPRMLGWGFVGLFLPTAFFLDRVAREPGSSRLEVILIVLAGMQCYLSMLAYSQLGRTGQILLVVGFAGVFVVGSAAGLLAYRRLSPAQEFSPAVLEDGR